MIDDRCRLTYIAGLAMRTVVAVRLGFRLWPIRFFRSPRFGDRPLLNVPLRLNRFLLLNLPLRLSRPLPLNLPLRLSRPLLPLRRHVLLRPRVVAG